MRKNVTVRVLVNKVNKLGGSFVSQVTYANSREKHFLITLPYFYPSGLPVIICDYDYDRAYELVRLAESVFAKI